MRVPAGAVGTGGGPLSALHVNLPLRNPRLKNVTALPLQQADPETILTPRFYTTDFDDMEELFSLEKNPNLKVK